jgi:hypothetical protein
MSYSLYEFATPGRVFFVYKDMSEIRVGAGGDLHYECDESRSLTLYSRSKAFNWIAEFAPSSSIATANGNVMILS